MLLLEEKKRCKAGNINKVIISKKSDGGSHRDIKNNDKI